MPRSSVRIVLRTRPCEGGASQQPLQQPHMKIDQHAQIVTFLLPGRSHCLPKDTAGQGQQYTFKFDEILHGASQEDVYQSVGAPAVRAALDGVNATVMCYGQTGAGKTHTMTGPRRSYCERGLVPRCISAVLAGLRGTDVGHSSFGDREGAGDTSSPPWTLRLSYLEVYGEALFDLLDPASGPGELGITDDDAGRVQVTGLRTVAVRTEEEALALFMEGESNRIVGAHALNRESSRSHAVFMLSLTAPAGADTAAVLSSRLTLVDLAGSERLSKTGSEGALPIREAGAINRSLALLEQVVVAASERGREHVPYRSCKLTHVLRDAIGGNCATTLVANVWAHPGQLEESVSTARFATRMARLHVEVVRNVVSAPGGARVRALEREVCELREELCLSGLLAAHQELEAGTACSISDMPVECSITPSADQRARARQAARLWLASGADMDSNGHMTLLGLPLARAWQLREVLIAAKVMVQELLQCKVAGTQNAAPKISNAGAVHTPTLHTRGPQSLAEMTGVGDGVDISVGDAAPDNARPATYGGGGDDELLSVPYAITMEAKQQQQQQQDQQDHQQQYCTPSRGDITAEDAAVVVLDGAEPELQTFLGGPGASYAVLLKENANRLRAERRATRSAGLQLNALVARLNAARAAAAALKDARVASGTGVLGKEEAAALDEVRQLKAQYRDAHAERQLHQDQAAYAAGLLDACQQELATAFAGWLQDIGSNSTQAALLPVVGAATSPPGSGSGLAGAAVGRPRASSPPLPNMESTVGSAVHVQSTAEAEGLDDQQAAAAFDAALRHTTARSSSGAAATAARQRSSVAIAKQRRGERGTFTATTRSSAVTGGAGD